MPSILIVDDDPTIATMLERALARLGTIDRAARGTDALRMLGAKKYEILLLDLHMPGLDGLQVLQVLAGKPGPNSDTPCFVITADTSDRARAEALRHRAAFFLPKPLSLTMLSALVESTLTKQRVLGTAARSKPGP
jgi:DNA-binding response OmpR family regulator